jgi:predicted NBD/HSP70 family sugar kinase
VILTHEQRSVLHYLWREGARSRSGLHELTGVAPNRVGAAATGLMELGLVRECQARPSGGGRPRVPLEIDPGQRHVIGLTIWPGAVSAAKLNLQGNLVGKPVGRYVTGGTDRLVVAAAALLEKVRNDKALGVGVSMPGFYDPAARRALSGMMATQENPVSLSPLFDCAGGLPLVVENDMHALGARWLLTHRAEAGHDALLVNISDGALGAAVLIGGRPSRGCVSSANELGHMRYLADTARCYCGQAGCLERIFSSEYLRHIEEDTGRIDVDAGLDADGVPARDSLLMRRSATYEQGDEALETLYGYLANGIVNVVNFMRPHRLVIVSELTRYPNVCDLLTRSIRSRLLGELINRVRFDLWDQPVGNPAETAGWLALANLYYDGWQ